MLKQKVLKISSHKSVMLIGYSVLLIIGTKIKPDHDSWFDLYLSLPDAQQRYS